MPGSSPTVASLAVQIANVRQNQEELRSLLRDILGEMLRISQTQAEANSTMLRIMERAQDQMLSVSTLGPPISRTTTEEDELVQYRASRLPDQVRGDRYVDESEGL